ncbi:protein CWC15 homolog [Drosophila sulfurigaster albostrigata]|uniref:protein CWC15 homolog n=1 Tax=Drosophila sulfurigaster albostrigata TaxID=89887 RepID=UPI002D21D63B|nr:protein CWC15 homolog [Drosophila sulfurigaster albostrigata]
MTTAARPTFDPARGGSGRGEKDLSALSKQYSSRDLPGHTKLKYRETGQGTSEEIRNRDFRKELEERERDARSGVSSGKALPSIVRKAIEANNASSSSSTKRAKLDSSSQLQQQQQQQQQQQHASANLDADEPLDNDSSDSDSDSDDDDAALLAELQKIKQERLQETARREAEKKQEDERIRMENILSGNPLINYEPGTAASAAGRTSGLGGDLKVKRRWDDDVVFKNCARSAPEKKTHFVNDALRSDFHKKFMDKYIK